MAEPRVGKTTKDRKNGAMSRNKENVYARGQWSNGSDKQFPTHTCGGKGNSSVPYKVLPGRGRVQA